MDDFGVFAFIIATSALSIAVLGFYYAHGRLNKLEKKLKDYGVIPREFESISREFDPLKKELDKLKESGKK